MNTNLIKLLGIFLIAVIGGAAITSTTADISVTFLVNNQDLLQEKVTIDISKPIDVYLNIQNTGNEDLVLESVRIKIEKAFIPVYSAEFSDKEIEEFLQEQGYEVNLVLAAGEQITITTTIEDPKAEMEKELSEDQIEWLMGSWRISLDIFFENKFAWTQFFEVELIDTSV